MKRTMGGAALLAALVALAPMTVNAQVGPRGMAGMGPGARGGGVERILRQKERLELTDAQVKQLDKIREEAVQRRSERQAEMAELRSRVAAGLVKPDSLRKEMQSRREAAAAIQESQRTRIEGVLTDAQKEKIREFGAQARAFRMGRMSAMRGGCRCGAPAGAVPGGEMRQRFGPGGGQPMGPMGGPRSRRGPGGGTGYGPPADSIPR